MNKKGNFFSLVIVLAFIAILAIGSLFFGGLVKDMGAGLREAVNDGDMENKTNSLSAVEKLETDAVGYADNFAFWFLIAIIIGLILSGLFLDFEPTIVVIMLVVAGLAVGMSMLIANMYTDIASDSSLASVAQEMTLSGAVYGQVFPIIIFIAFIISLILMYSRRGGNNQYAY